MAQGLHVEAAPDGRMAATARARGHEVHTDEPTTAGGNDAAMMPTELFCASLATCFCTAVRFVAAKREIELPGLRVTVDAERVGRELRYGRLRVEVAANAEEEQLQRLVERARAFCWVSNMLDSDIETQYVAKGPHARQS